MASRSRLALAFLASILVAAPNLLADAIERAPALPATTPWDLGALGAAPAFEWVDSKSAVRSLTYSGELYRGKATRVFALYATPGTLAGDPSKDRKLPAVVLVHGGGGKAFKEWVELWAGRGYAAIAMDLAGKDVGDAGGPDQGDDTKFGSIALPVTEHWSYHAVANVIRAHSLVRSFAEVDVDRTAVTGISWGGYLTCIAASLDSRFKAAVPVYGCGFLHENSVWKEPQLDKMTPELRARWIALYDPSSYLRACRVPMFFLNGTNDFAYPLDSYKKSFDLVKAPRLIRVTVNMPHGHPEGWALREIGIFIDSQLRGEPPLPRTGELKRAGNRVTLGLPTKSSVREARLHFTEERGPINRRNWTTSPMTLGDAGAAGGLPAGATVWFATVTDDRGAVVSSEVEIAPVSTAGGVKSRVDAIVEPYVASGSIVGLAVGLLGGGERSVLGYGKTSARGGRLPDGDTLFEIGSITKVFTGLLLAKMVGDGLVKLDDPIQKLLPPNATVPKIGDREITLVDLATHASGLPRMPADWKPADPQDPYADFTAVRLYASLKSLTPSRKPGEAYEYSNLGVGLLGHALALKSRKPYEDLVVETISTPLGMPSTRVRLSAKLSARLAPGHDADGSPVKNWQLGALAGAGGLRSSVNDLLEFAAANLGLKTTELAAAIDASHVERETKAHLALCWHLRKNGEVLFHNGGTGGYRSYLALDPKRRVAVIVLANTATDSVDEVGDALLALLRDEPVEVPKSKPVALVDRKILETYVGQYEVEPAFVLKVTHDSGKLFVQATGQGKFRVYPASDTEFLYRTVEARITFEKDGAGRVSGLVLHQNGRDMPARKRR